MKRIKVASIDVMKPFAILMAWNVLQLGLTTGASPLQYTRIYDQYNLDRFGRPMESHASCRPTNGFIYLFLGLACLANLAGFLFAARMCYKVRHISFYFSETFYFTISMGSFCETLILGTPILVLLRDTTSAFFLVGSAGICICCLCFLLPVFVPKYTYRDSRYDDARDVDAMNISRHSNHSTASCQDGQNQATSLRAKHGEEFSSLYSNSSIPGLMSIRRLEFRNSAGSEGANSRRTLLSNVSGIDLDALRDNSMGRLSEHSRGSR